MYCKHCRRKIDDDSQFCTFCGKPQSQTNFSQSIEPSVKKKGSGKWQLIVGAIILGIAIPTLFSDFFVALILGIIAFLLLRKGWALYSLQKNEKTALPKTIPATRSKSADTVSQTSHARITQGVNDKTMTGCSSQVSAVAETKPTTSASPYITKKYRVAGTTHYLDNIMNLAIENGDYDMTKKEIVDSFMTGEKIWKYEFYPSKIELIPEPENPHDKNAIKVIVDGEHVGYIKSGSCVHLLKVIKENRIHSIDCDIGGGPFKIVSEEYDYEKGKDVYTLEKDERGFSVVLQIDEITPNKK